MRRNWFIVVVLSFTLANALAASAADSKKPSWKITGQLEEACTSTPRAPVGSIPSRQR